MSNDQTPEKTSKLEVQLLEDHRFSGIKQAMKEAIADLKEVTKDGFSSLRGELVLTREQGHIPISVMEKILASNNEAYKDMIATITTSNQESRKSSDQNYTKILSTVCLMLAGLLAWVTGMKVFLPDKILYPMNSISPKVDSGMEGSAK